MLVGKVFATAPRETSMLMSEIPFGTTNLKSFREEVIPGTQPIIPQEAA